MVAYQVNVAHQCLLPPRLCLFSSLAAPPNSHFQKKVIPGCIGIKMVSSNLFCLFAVRFEWDIVLSSSYDIRKAWIHHVMSWEGTSTLLNCVWFYIKLVWIQETYPEFLVLKVKLHEVKFTTLNLTLSWRRPISYRNQSIDFLHKSMDWFLYDNGLRHKRVNIKSKFLGRSVYY